MKMLHMLIACLALASLSHGQQDQNPGFISIDCGASKNYTDQDYNIYYSNDDSFVDSGTNMPVSTDAIYTSTVLFEENMRVFPNGTRNCYTLRPEQGKNKKYLIRASFLYGNYDGQNRPPAFHLHIDVNYWDKVDTAQSFWTEIIYAPPRDYIQVCLVNIERGDPFISAIKLRLLNDSIYPIVPGALWTYSRFDLGSNGTYSYPQDNYDRIWTSKTVSGWSSISNTTAIITGTSNDDYKVPPEVLMTAEEVQNVNDSLSLFWTSSNSSTTWYVCFHFAELQLRKGQLRELATYVGNEFVKSIILENLKPVTVVSTPFNGSYLSFTVNATGRSSLPPLLNAVETYSVLDLPYSPTFLGDFDAMYDVKKTYKIAIASWQGDPCVPSLYKWSQVNCSYDVSPRVVSLNLHSIGLKGLIATSFSNLTALESLDLSNNQLTGLVPDFFAQMPNLKILNLSGNNFNCSVPQALSNKMADGSLQLSLEGNQNPCQSNPQPTNTTVGQTKKKSTYVTAIIVGISLAIVLLTAFAIFWRIKRRRDHASGGSNQNLRERKNQPFTSAEVIRITDNFRTVIGEGAFGKVYLGHLGDGNQGTQVAVKLLTQSSKQGYKEFHAEVQLLMVVHHKNLVSLIGYCEESKHMALIYEFMSNGNVRQHLSENNPNVISWMQRLQIAINIAQGLEYLHDGCKPPIIHRDLKSTNILLNDSMQAKIADFGLSKVFVTDLDSHITTCPAGTPGYLDPEFHKSGILSKKSDVYGFGVVLFELITGRPPFIRSQDDRIHILHWVTSLIERGDIESIVDPRLQGKFNIGSVWRAVEIAMSCVQTAGVQRPNMDWVLYELKECLAAKIGSGSSERIESSTGRSGSFEMTTSDLAR